MRWSAVLALVLMPLLAGCADRGRNADDLAVSGGLSRVSVPVRSLVLGAWVRLRDPIQPVTIYLEGDGAAYDGDGRPSQNPTPRRALALALAAQDGAANVIYLARPCQFSTERCPVALYTEERFAEAAVSAVNDAVDRLKAPGQRLHLIGFSGGGAIAALLAERRDDVLSLRTVAGNLSPAAVNRYHGLAPMSRALDPMAAAGRLATLPQVHFIGSRDRIVPATVAEDFIRQQAAGSCARLVRVDASHEDGWRERWPDLLRQVPAC